MSEETPSIIIGFVLSLKHLKNNGQLSDSQRELLQKYNYKYLVSSDYDEIIHQITNYMLETRSLEIITL